MNNYKKYKINNKKINNKLILIIKIIYFNIYNSYNRYKNNSVFIVIIIKLK